MLPSSSLPALDGPGSGIGRFSAQRFAGQHQLRTFVQCPRHPFRHIMRHHAARSDHTQRNQVTAPIRHEPDLVVVDAIGCKADRADKQAVVFGQIGEG